MSIVVEALPKPQIYYHSQIRGYLREDAKGKWISINEDSAKKFLASHGFDPHIRNGNNISQVDQCILDIQSNQNVDYVGPLAGYESGCHEINGRLILVTESAKLIDPCEGEWPILRQLIEGMFKDDQAPYLYGWLKRSMEMYRQHQWLPGQVLVLCGEICSGKSLFQGLVTEMFGGRSAKPHSYMTGRTDFNGDLFRAEHLMVEDQVESIDIRARRHFASGIKEISVNKEQHCHSKHQNGLTLTPLWRMTVSVNDDLERLQVIPPLDADVTDKIMLLKVTHQDMPMATGTSEEQQRFWDTLISELPHFLRFLENWKIPEELKSPRFGIVHYHHPDLVEALQQTAPELRLLELIDLELFSRPKSFLEPQGMASWEGTSAQLEHQLKSSLSKVQYDAKQLLHYSTNCGCYLSRLEKRSHSRVSKRKSHGNHIWTIKPPEICLGELGQHVFDISPGTGNCSSTGVSWGEVGEHVFHILGGKDNNIGTDTVNSTGSKENIGNMLPQLPPNRVSPDNGVVRSSQINKSAPRTGNSIKNPLLTPHFLQDGRTQTLTENQPKAVTDAESVTYNPEPQTQLLLQLEFTK